MMRFVVFGFRPLFRIETDKKRGTSPFSVLVGPEVGGCVLILAGPPLSAPTDRCRTEFVAQAVLNLANL
jgi:hypothetical protein